MRIITRAGLARKAVARYQQIRDQRPVPDSTSPDRTCTITRVCSELESLGVDPWPDDVDRILGGAVDLGLRCDECHREDVETVVEFTNCYCEDGVVYVCAVCLRLASERAVGMY